jgi:adenosylcobyric acid synthase
MKALMVVGTTSHAGKSFLTTALCRILHRQGWQVTPFKGQNMALNAYVTNTGGEMGYAQAVQAWAANTTPRVEMNPILLKPQGDMTSQVIILGKTMGKTKAAEYYQQYFDLGWNTIKDSLAQLAKEFDVVVCEGAGSPAEINLKHRDLTNMRIATHLNAPTILVVDIDRGGAFAHVVGTLELLEPEERALVRGVIINKFRGQRSLLDSGITWLEERTGIPVLGVIPWTDQVFSAEDSLNLSEKRSRSSNYALKIGVIRLPRISNFNDFEPLESEATLSIEYVDLYQDLGYPDAVIIPGSKTTINDLIELKKSGMAKQLQDYAASGGTIMGICGGFQMLGQEIEDPDKIEGEITSCQGLDLLPMKTVFLTHKNVRQRRVFSKYPQSDLPIDGYEIHLGHSQLIPPHTLGHNSKYKPMFSDPNLGMVNENQSIWGCYLHGLFDNSSWRRSWLNILRRKRGLPSLPTGIPNYREQREVMLNSLANLVEKYVDLTTIFSWLK